VQKNIVYKDSHKKNRHKPRTLLFLRERSAPFSLEQTQRRRRRRRSDDEWCYSDAVVGHSAAASEFFFTFFRNFSHHPIPLLLLIIDPQLVFAKTHSQSLDLQKRKRKEKKNSLPLVLRDFGSAKSKQAAAPSSSTNPSRSAR